ncbi:CopG family transcriptional regulator [Planomonospora sp. ID67723]|uniref:ribbon-helix-helix domain-containing protein n=1 Tax=Planomonospora sp. ID67723 TaxID=2738134 RepID=UPI0018C3759B|nr:CopG family transcriptional regulator [Planomonospora sp. ID67723]MBG0828574.1 CopG family transcriptional regulator [Planomonospora sp. ID67723]
MARVNVYSRDPYEEKTLLGWFDPNTCVEQIDEDTYWDGNNHRGVISGGQVGYERLYRTKGGRWVRYYNFTAEFNGPEYYEFLDDEAAQTWLLKNSSDGIVEKYFGELEEERGPGRPVTVGGKPIKIRLGEDLEKRVDAVRQEGESQAAAIRRLLEQALTQ